MLFWLIHESVMTLRQLPRRFDLRGKSLEENRFEYSIQAQRGAELFKKRLPKSLEPLFLHNLEGCWCHSVLYFSIATVSEQSQKYHLEIFWISALSSLSRTSFLFKLLRDFSRIINPIAIL